MRTRGLITVAVATSALLASCSVDPIVTAERSDQIASPTPSETTPATTTPESTDPSTNENQLPKLGTIPPLA